MPTKSVPSSSWYYSRKFSIFFVCLLGDCNIPYNHIFWYTLFSPDIIAIHVIDTTTTTSIVCVYPIVEFLVANWVVSYPSDSVIR